MKAPVLVCTLLSLPLLMEAADNYTAKRITVEGFEVV